MCFSRIVLANMHCYFGEYERAEASVAQAQAAALRLGASYLVRWAGYVRGKILAERGALAEAQTALNEVIATVGNSPRIVCGARIYLANALARAGDPEGAAEHARAALALRTTEPMRAAALAALTRALLLKGELAEADQASRESEALLAGLGSMEEFESLVRLARAEALIAQGQAPGEILAAAGARLDRIAEEIVDPVRRDTFLTRVPEHARIRQLLASPGRPATAATARPG
jgi:ATP/maltotriose-dependent transcriptional regulator MalT